MQAHPVTRDSCTNYHQNSPRSCHPNSGREDEVEEEKDEENLLGSPSSRVFITIIVEMRVCQSEALDTSFWFRYLLFFLSVYMFYLFVHSSLREIVGRG